MALTIPLALPRLVQLQRRKTTGVGTAAATRTAMSAGSEPTAPAAEQAAAAAGTSCASAGGGAGTGGADSDDVNADNGGVSEMLRCSICEVDLGNRGTFRPRVRLLPCACTDGPALPGSLSLYLLSPS